MPNLNNIFRPLTSHPFKDNETYTEIEPCDALKPYVRCFWGTPKPCLNSISKCTSSSLVTPDTCMDIIFNINHDDNKTENLFCGINDIPFASQAQNVTQEISCFAIRFYFWAVPLFSNNSMKNAMNTFVDVEAYFEDFQRQLEPILIDKHLIGERAVAAEEYLLKKLNLGRQNNNVLNSIYYILKSKGTFQISELTHYTAVGQRQLERLFLEYIGITPKKLSKLIRYQYLWQDIVSNPKLCIQDAVFRYNFTDQAHLLKEFKNYHSMTPSEGRTLAYRNR